MKTGLTRATLGLALFVGAVPFAHAQDKNIKIGVLTDMSGLYSDISGPGSVAAAKMAVEDSGLAKKGWKIDVISADHQNKPDVGGTIARQWFDTEKVDVIADVPTSSVALAVNNVVKEKNGILLNSGAGTSDLTNAQCTPNTIHWAYDTSMLSHVTGSALTKNGGDTWFFLTADYAFGNALERDATAVITANGGKVIGSVRHPLNSSDFSSFLLQAQSSKSKVIGLANAGGDTINSLKQAAEFGIVSGGQKIAGLLIFLSDVHSLGLQTAQGLNLTESFYWDLNDQTRAFSKRFAERMPKRAMPTMVQAGVYSAVLHYLRVLDSEGKNSHDGAKIVAAMKANTPDDPLFGKGPIQLNGRKIHPAYLFEVKKPSESKGPWDYYKLVATIPADQAFTPLDKSACPLSKR
jgi:branched-chain amino acid transport system substrate-binding protein